LILKSNERRKIEYINGKVITENWETLNRHYCFEPTLKSIKHLEMNWKIFLGSEIFKPKEKKENLTIDIAEIKLNKNLTKT
jgi:hypothetical protein